MQSYISDIPDVFNNIINPVAQQMVHRIKKDLGLISTFDNRLYFNSDHTGASKSSTPFNNPKLKDTRMDINLQYNLNPLNMQFETTTFRNMIRDRAGLKDIYHKRVSPKHSTITSPLLLSHLSNVISDLYFSAIYNSEISTDSKYEKLQKIKIKSIGQLRKDDVVWS